MQNSGIKNWCSIPYRKPPKPTVCRYFRGYLRYYGPINMAETGFNEPMYLILLKYNATNKNSLYLYNFYAAFGVILCENIFLNVTFHSGVTLLNTQ